MLKLFSIGLVASVVGLGIMDSGPAYARSRYARSHCCGCCVAQTAPATSDQCPAPAPQASADTYRRFSFEPLQPAPVYQQSAPARRWIPGYMMQKSDPRKFNGGGWE